LVAAVGRRRHGRRPPPTAREFSRAARPPRTDEHARAAARRCLERRRRGRPAVLSVSAGGAARSRRARARGHLRADVLARGRVPARRRFRPRTRGGGAPAAAADRPSLRSGRHGRARRYTAAGTHMITLREISREDLPTINGWRRDPVVADGVGAPRRFIGLDVDVRWYEDYLTRRGTEVRCAVCLADSAELVGMVSLTRIDYVHSHAEFNAESARQTAHRT